MKNSWENEYVKSMEQMKFTGKQKERMAARLKNHSRTAKNAVQERLRFQPRKMQNQHFSNANLFAMLFVPQKARHGKTVRNVLPQGIWRLAAAGICLCILAAGAAGANAAGLLKPASEVFHEAFHLDDTTSKITDEIGSSLDASDTYGGVTVTADAAIGDKYNYCILFSMKRDDGGEFSRDDIVDLENHQDSIAFDSFLITEKENEDDEGVRNRRGYVQIYDADQEDNSIQLLYTCASDSDKSIGKAIFAQFRDFGYYNTSMRFVPVVKGHWKLNFQIDYADSAKELTAGQQFTDNGYDITIENIEISPIGFHVGYMIDGETLTGKKEKAFRSIPVTLTLNNGKTMDLAKKSKGSSMWSEDGNTHFAVGSTFHKIIPVEEMKSLRIGDIAFSL